MTKGKIVKLIPILAWLVICAGLLVGWVYLFGSITKKIASINEIKIQAKNAELKLEQRRDLENLVNEVAAQKQKIDSLFLNKDTLINFIEQLEGSGKATGVTLKIDSSGQEGNPVFRLSAEGSYTQVFRFLQLLENFPYKVDIGSIVLQEQGGAVAGATGWKTDLELTLLSYEAKI